MPSLISRLIVCAIFILTSYILYTNYISDNTKLDQINQNVTGSSSQNPAAQKFYIDASNFNGIYLYNPNSDNLYLKRPNPDFNSTTPGASNISAPFLYYNAGKGMDCPGILNNDNSLWQMNANSSGITPAQYILIQDTYTQYYCPDVLKDPNADPALKSQCQGNNGSTLFLTSAGTLEQNLIDLCKQQGNVTVMSPQPTVCYPPDKPLTKQASQGNTPVQVGPANFAEFLSQNKEMIIALIVPLSGAAGSKIASLAGKEALAAKMSVVSSVVGHFMMIYMILPGFWENPVNSWEWTKNTAMAGQMVLDKCLEKFIAYAGEKVAQTAAGKSVMSVAQDAAISTVSEMSTGSKMLAGALDFANAFEKGMTVLAFIQVALMIVDAIDPCGLTNPSMNLTQEMFDKYRYAYDKGVFFKTG